MIHEIEMAADDDFRVGLAGHCTNYVGSLSPYTLSFDHTAGFFEELMNRRLAVLSCDGAVCEPCLHRFGGCQMNLERLRAGAERERYRTAPTADGERPFPLV